VVQKLPVSARPLSYAVAQALRARPDGGQVHIAAVTGWGHDDDRRKARDAGCDSHFTKPLVPATLQKMLAAIAERDPRESRAAWTPGVNVP
jgi:CheY-like chemotaxis protein